MNQYKKLVILDSIEILHNLKNNPPCAKIGILSILKNELINRSDTRPEEIKYLEKILLTIKNDSSTIKEEVISLLMNQLINL